MAETYLYLAITGQIAPGMRVITSLSGASDLNTVSDCSVVYETSADIRSSALICPFCIKFTQCKAGNISIGGILTISVRHFHIK